MDAERCVSAMLGAERPRTPIRLDGLKEPLELQYYRIPDGAELFDSERLVNLLPGVARAAIEQAGLTAAELEVLPVFVGSSCFSVSQAEHTYQTALVRDAAAMPMPVCDYDLPARLARQAIGSSGETWSYNTACSSAANALLGALSMLRLGRYPHALVVGAELANRTTLLGFGGLQVLADEVRPFDAARRGMVLGEGVAAVLVSTQPGRPGALRLHGGSNNCDTHNVTTANPDGRSVASVLRRALARAGLTPREVCAIKAHGTASPSGDQAEAAGLRQLFDSLPPLTALKPYLGHTLGACGINELVLFAGALERGVIPATIGFETAVTGLEVEPLREPIPAPDGHYLLNHFGFGGNNTVLVMEKDAP
jgi:3-oxoacyl-[acyl-carrier-protein] synthase-1